MILVKPPRGNAGPKPPDCAMRSPVAADELRGVLHRHQPISELLNEERVFIHAREAIVDDAVRRGNREILNLTDILLGGGGVAAGGPLGAGLSVGAVRAFKQPMTATGLGQGLHRIGRRLPATAPRTIGPALAVSPRAREEEVPVDR